MFSYRRDHLIERTGTDYAAVIAVAKRARQLGAWRHRHELLDDAAFERLVPPMLPNPSNNDLTTALEELEQGKFRVRNHHSR